MPPPVFYFGNAIGDTLNGQNDSMVNSLDLAGITDHFRNQTNPAPIDFRWDFNRDGLVNALDIMIARDNFIGFGASLKRITV